VLGITTKQEYCCRGVKNTFPKASKEKLASFSQTNKLFTSKVIMYSFLISMASHHQYPTSYCYYQLQPPTPGSTNISK
jgi:hypothetical protein